MNEGREGSDSSNGEESELHKLKSMESILSAVRGVRIPGMTQFQDLSTELMAKILSYLDIKSIKKIYKTKKIAGDSFLFAERLIPAANMAILMNLREWTEFEGEEIDMQALDNFDAAAF